MKPGDLCTVSHHYGHTDTKKVMTIEAIEPDSRMKTGIAVKVDGLPSPVSSGLINVIKLPKKAAKLKQVTSNHFYLTTAVGTVHVNMNPNADKATFDAVNKMVEMAFNMPKKK